MNWNVFPILMAGIELTESSIDNRHARKLTNFQLFGAIPNSYAALWNFIFPIRNFSQVASKIGRRISFRAERSRERKCGNPSDCSHSKPKSKPHRTRNALHKKDSEREKYWEICNLQILSGLETDVAE